MPFACPSLPARSHPVPSRQGGGAPFLLRRLLVEPLVEHGPRKADVPAHTTARQAATPHGLVDPARLDVQIPSGLLRAKKPILRERRRRPCCRCWSLHTPYRPPSAQTGQRILRHFIVPTWRRPSAPKSPPELPAGPSAPPTRPSREIGREIEGPIRARCYAAKRCVCRAFLYAGGGTRTPDTRIMIRLPSPQVGSD